MSKRLFLPLLSAILLTAVSLSQIKTAAQTANRPVIKSYQAKADFALTADPNSASWKGVKGVTADNGPRGEKTPDHHTEIRSRWTDRNLYILFISHYDKLYPKPNPSTTTETNKLWEWDVAEVFIGTDFKDIKHYTEFQVSPSGEWVDLDIDRKPDPPKHDVGWNSGFEVKAKINEKDKVWYGEMKIPMAKIDQRAAKVGNEMRINFYRFQGPPPNRQRIAWSPVNSDNYHTPEAFGLLKLEK
jgi:hypothetical protein